MCAVSSGRLENTKLLIEAGANVNLEDENEETVLLMTKGTLLVLYYCYWVGNADILKLFIHLIHNINKQVSFCPIHNRKHDCIERIWSYCFNESCFARKYRNG